MKNKKINFKKNIITISLILVAVLVSACGTTGSNRGDLYMPITKNHGIGIKQGNTRCATWHMACNMKGKKGLFN